MFRIHRVTVAANGGSAGSPEVEQAVDRYFRGLQRVAQFGMYEKLFSMWHVAHVPFVVLLAVSAIYHVIAVHMY